MRITFHVFDVGVITEGALQLLFSLRSLVLPLCYFSCLVIDVWFDSYSLALNSKF